MAGQSTLPAPHHLPSPSTHLWGESPKVGRRRRLPGKVGYVLGQQATLRRRGFELVTSLRGGTQAERENEGLLRKKVHPVLGALRGNGCHMHIKFVEDTSRAAWMRQIEERIDTDTTKQREMKKKINVISKTDKLPPLSPYTLPLFPLTRPTKPHDTEYRRHMPPPSLLTWCIS